MSHKFTQAAVYSTYRCHITVGLIDFGIWIVHTLFERYPYNRRLAPRAVRLSIKPLVVDGCMHAALYICVKAERLIPFRAKVIF